jgi:predicted HicB family RNase H-like nuclease
MRCELSVVRSDDEAENSAVLILREARCLFAQVPAWTKFYHQLLSTEGLIGLLSAEERAAFEKSLAYAEIQGMLAELRQRRLQRRDFEPQHVITVRLPKSLHEALRDEAHRLRTSLNQLAISKLLQAIDPINVPSDF